MGFQHRVGAGFAVALLAWGCGGADPAVDLAEASAEVEQAQTAVDQARETVVAREADVAAAQQQLADARAQVRLAEVELTKREAAVDRSATDTVLFRTVQHRLLEADELENVAISAGVADSVVTLSGTVANAKQRDRAVAVATETPGVERVESRIRVQVAAPPPTE